MRSSFFIPGAILMAVAASSAAAPEFTGTWVNGDPLKSSALKGKLTVLVFYEEG